MGAMGKYIYIAGIVIGVSIAAFCTLRLSQQLSQQTTSIYTNSDSQKTRKDDGIFEALRKRVADWWFTNDAVAYFTGWLALFTLLLVVVSASQISFLISADRTATKSANAAENAANVAKETLVASRRPWIVADVTVGKPVEVYSGGIRFTLRFNMQNKGADPAFYVFPYFKIISNNRGSHSLIQKQNEFCEEIKGRANGPNNGGFTIFPGQPREMSLTINVSLEDFEADVAADVERRAIRVRTGWPDVPVINPIIIGCIDYQFGEPFVHHQTRFAYQIMDKGIDNHMLGGNQMLLTPDAIPDGRLAIDPDFITRGTFFAD